MQMYGVSTHMRLSEAMAGYKYRMIARGGVSYQRQVDIDFMVKLIDIIEDERDLLIEIHNYLKTMKTSWYGFFTKKSELKKKLMEIVLDEEVKHMKERERIRECVKLSQFCQSNTFFGLDQKMGLRASDAEKSITINSEGERKPLMLH